MTPDNILLDLVESGIKVQLTPDWKHIEITGEALTDHQRASILANRAALIRRLIEVSRQRDQVLRAAMRVCDRWHDGTQARADMKRDVMETPIYLLPDLYNHFTGRNIPTGSTNINTPIKGQTK